MRTIDTRTTKKTFRTFVLARPSPAGLIGLLVFFWFSLTPTLLPRSWVMQAGISALSMAIGYGIGAFIGWGAWTLWLRQGREFAPEEIRRRI